MSTSAASHLPPAFPERAAWGTAGALRAWQAAALERYLAEQPRDFLAVATPGAGKTTFALRIATELLRPRTVERVTVVAPTEHLKPQWADAARAGRHRASTPRSPTPRARHGRDFDGVAVTYARSPASRLLHRARTEAARTLVILDEIHHGGDALSWGEASARRSSRPRGGWRSPARRSAPTPAAIPFVALRAGPRRHPPLARPTTPTATPTRCATASCGRCCSWPTPATMRWRTSAGDEVAARLGEPLTKDLTAQAWRTALDPKGEWIPSVLRRRRHAADRGAPARPGRRRAGHRHRPGRGPGLRGAAARSHRRAAHRRAVRRRRRLGSDRGVRRGRRSAGWSPCGWSPRASTCPGSRSASTRPQPRRRCSSPRRSAGSSGPGAAARPRRSSCPACRRCCSSPAAMELERDHALDRRPTRRRRTLVAGGRPAGRGRTGREAPPDELERLRSRRSDSHAEFDRVLFDARASSALRARPAAQEEQDYLGLPGLLEPDQVAHVLRERQADQVALGRRPAARRATSRPTEHWPSTARSSTASSRPMPASPVSRTPWCTPSCAGSVADRSWRPRAASRCCNGSRPCAGGSWAAAEAGAV